MSNQRYVSICDEADCDKCYKCRNAELEATIAELGKQVSFYRSCMLSGEIGEYLEKADE